MSHLARGPRAHRGIDSKANAAHRRRADVGAAIMVKEAAA